MSQVELTTQPKAGLGGIVLRTAVAQATGTSHRDQGCACEDAHALAYVAGADGKTWLIAAVADGAGSAAMAEIGAEAAAQLTVDALAELIGSSAAGTLEECLVTAATFALLELELMAEVEDRPIEDYASTLLVTITNGERSAFLQIGDGAIVVGPPWRLGLAPQHGAYVNETVFLVSAGAISARRHRDGRPAGRHHRHDH